MWNCNKCQTDVDFNEVEQGRGPQGHYFFCPYCAQQNLVTEAHTLQMADGEPSRQE